MKSFFAKRRKKKENISESFLTKQDKIQLYLFCAIPLVLVFVFSYLPMAGIVIAFKNYKYNLGIFGSKWVGFKNFEFLFKSNDFLRLIRNTVGMNFLFIILGTTAAIAVAILLFETTGRRNVKTYQTILITPNFLSWVVVSYMVYALLNPELGMTNRLLEHFGFQAVDWYSKPNAWPVILTITSVWQSVGMNSVIYYASLMGISSELFEAAEIDGANRWQKIIHITIPSIIPLIVMMTILRIGNMFRADFGLFYQVTRNVGTLYQTTDVLDTYIFRTLRVTNNMGMSAAAGLLQSVVGFILVMLTNRLVKKHDPNMALF